jgi:plastocyanin
LSQIFYGYTIFILLSIVLITINVLFSNGYAQVSSQILISPGSSSPFNPKFYDPPTKTISKGESITWRNNDLVDHSVTFIDPQLNPPTDIVKPNSTFTHKFDEAGRYDYYCRFYPFMTGQIEVTGR